jgi:hypothetical protein
MPGMREGPHQIHRAPPGFQIGILCVAHSVKPNQSEELKNQSEACWSLDNHPMASSHLVVFLGTVPLNARVFCHIGQQDKI